MVRLVADRNGRVISATLVQSCGRPILDEAAVAWLQRANPVPALPDDWPNDRLDIIVPLRFHLR